MDSESRPKWERLGRLLAERRGRLDPRFTVRKVFAENVSVHPAILRDIETAARDNYGPATLASVEQAYRWAPGSIQLVLDGGGPIEIAEVSGQTSMLLTGSAGTIRTRPGQGSIQTDDGLKAALRELAKRLPQHEVRALLEEFAPAEDEADDRYTDPQERHLWRTPGLDARGRRYLIGQLQAYHRLQETSVVDQGEADVREIRKHG